MKKSAVFVTWLSLTFLIGSILFFISSLIFGNGDMLTAGFALAVVAIVLFAANQLSVVHGLWALWIGHIVATLDERLDSHPRLKRVFPILFWGTSGAIWLFSIYLAFIVARYGREIMPYNETVGLASICLTATILFITPILILKPARFLSLGVLYSALAAFAYMVSNSLWIFVLVLTPGAIFVGWKIWLLRQKEKQDLKDIDDNFEAWKKKVEENPSFAAVTAPKQIASINGIRNHLNPRLSDEDFDKLKQAHPDLMWDLCHCKPSLAKSVLLARIQGKQMSERLHEGLDHIGSWAELESMLEFMKKDLHDSEELYFRTID